MASPIVAIGKERDKEYTRKEDENCNRKIMSSSGIPDSSMLCSNTYSKMATYCSAFILSSTSLKIHIPFHPMQPYTISEPPPNLTIFWTSLAISPSPLLFHTYSCPSDPILLILVLFDHITLFQSSTVLYIYLRAKANLLCLWPLERCGFSSSPQPLSWLPWGYFSQSEDRQEHQWWYWCIEWHEQHSWPCQ